jgi:plastocyanin
MSLRTFGWVVVSSSVVIAACASACSSSTTGGTVDAGTASDGSTVTPDDGSTTTDSSVAANPCDAPKACPNDPEPSAEQRAACRAEAAGSCGKEALALLDCLTRASTCGANGTSETPDGACTTEQNALVACKTPKGDGGSDATTSDASNDASTDAAALVNGCTSYLDATTNGDLRTLTWDFGIASSTQRCLIVKAGQTVTFMGDFDFHPLAASGGDTPSPFQNGANGQSVVSFANTGTFGYVCVNHGSMNGAIRVVP